MSDSVFRSAPQSTNDVPATRPAPPDPSNVGAEVRVEEIEPLEVREERSGDILLESLGISEPLNNLPETDKENLMETKAYIKSIIKSRGIEPNVKNFNLVLDDVKSEMGLDEKVEPGKLLDRIGGVVKAWKELTFIKDMSEKKRVFAKLLRSSSSEDANRIVFEEAERRRIWQ